MNVVSQVAFHSRSVGQFGQDSGMLLHGGEKKEKKRGNEKRRVKKERREER